MRQVFECVFYAALACAALRIIYVEEANGAPQRPSLIYQIISVTSVIGFGPALGAAIGAIFGHQFYWALCGLFFGPGIIVPFWAVIRS